MKKKQQIHQPKCSINVIFRSSFMLIILFKRKNERIYFFTFYVYYLTIMEINNTKMVHLINKKIKGKGKINTSFIHNNKKKKGEINKRIFSIYHQHKGFLFILI